MSSGGTEMREARSAGAGLGMRRLGGVPFDTVHLHTDVLADHAWPCQREGVHTDPMVQV